MPKKRPWTDQELELARRLFENAKSAGKLKPPRAMAVVGLRSGGPNRTAWSQPDWRWYLREARVMIENDPANDW